MQQVATEVRRSYVKHPRQVKIAHLEIKYGTTSTSTETKSSSAPRTTPKQRKQQQTLINAKTLKHQRKNVLGGKKVVTLQVTPKEAAYLRSLPPAEASALRRQWARERLGAKGV